MSEWLWETQGLRRRGRASCPSLRPCGQSHLQNSFHYTPLELSSTVDCHRCLPPACIFVAVVLCIGWLSHLNVSALQRNQHQSPSSNRHLSHTHALGGGRPFSFTGTVQHYLACQVYRRIEEKRGEESLAPWKREPAEATSRAIKDFHRFCRYPTQPTPHLHSQPSS